MPVAAHLAGIDEGAVDPGSRGWGGWFGTVVEPFWVSSLRLVKYGLTVFENLPVPTGVQVSGAQVADSAVVVGVAVPVEERPTPLSSCLDASKSLRIVGAVLQGLELRFAIRIVI